jgi:hypothetical protein
LSSGPDGLYPVFWRELDTLIAAVILLLAGWLAALSLGLQVDVVEMLRRAREFLGFTAPLFFVATLFLVWTAGALLLEVSGLAPATRRWGRIAGALYYVENAAPFVGLLECFISIVTALLAYSSAGATAQAQSAMIASIAVALGASAAGCFVALCANSLRTLVAGRATDADRDAR